MSQSTSLVGGSPSFQLSVLLRWVGVPHYESRHSFEMGVPTQKSESLFGGGSSTGHASYFCRRVMLFDRRITRHHGVFRPSLGGGSPSLGSGSPCFEVGVPLGVGSPPLQLGVLLWSQESPLGGYESLFGGWESLFRGWESLFRGWESLFGIGSGQYSKLI